MPAWGVFALAVLALLLGNPVVAIVCIYLAAWTFALVTRNTALQYQLCIGSAISLAWMSVGHNQYGYAEHSVALFGITIFPVFAVPSALMGFYLIYETVHTMIPKSTPVIDWSLVIFLDLFLVVGMEYIGYHFFQIHNLATSQYSGFTWCNCFHAPWWMQLAYFSFPVIFFAAFRFLEKRFLRK